MAYVFDKLLTTIVRARTSGERLAGQMCRWPSKTIVS
jgi:hypothetical protein